MIRRIIFIWLPLILVFSAGSYASAQTRRASVPEKAIIHKDKSALRVYGKAVGFDRLFSKMDSLFVLDSGRVNILHMGGSHVEAGALTEHLRCNLMMMSDTTRYLNGGLGMVFPFVAAKGNNTPLGYTSHKEGIWTAYRGTKTVPDGQSLGLMGIVAGTADKNAQVSVVSRQRMGFSNPPRSWHNHITLLGYTSNESIAPVIEARDSVFILSSDVRDSLWRVDLPFEADSIIVRTNGQAGNMTISGMYLTNDDPGFVVSPIGINGASLVSYLRCNDIDRDLAIASPDLVILGIGINDASGTSFKSDLFLQRYSILVDKIRAVNPDCAIIFITNNDSCRRVKKTYVNNPNGALVQKAFHTLARKYDAAVWDLFEVMGGLKSIYKWESQGLAKKDKIHFTNDGYAILGDMLYNAIADEFDSWKDRQKVEGGGDQ